MSIKYRLVIFDWDGTLMDSVGHIVHCVQAAAKDLGLLVPADKEIRHGIGLDYAQQMARLFPQVTEEEYSAFRQAYEARFGEVASHAQPVLFPGVVETLQQLKDTHHCLLAIATGMPHLALQDVLAEYGLSKFFDITRSADQTFCKPHPQMVEEILEELVVAPHEAIMVGDTEYDMNTAKNAGVAAIAVDYGVHELADLLRCGPIASVGDIQQLIGVLESL